jgi:hypothetical protein
MEGGAEKIMEESDPPRQSVVRLFFVVVSAKDVCTFICLFLRSQKDWRETHLLDPLLGWVGCCVW